MENIFSGHTWPAMAQVAESIVSAISPDRIYLLSVIHQKEEIQSIFVKAPMQEFLVQALNILVLTGELEKRTNDELQDFIEHRLQIQIPVTAIVLPVLQFNEWLKKNHPFAVRVYFRSNLYYDSGRNSLVTPNEYNEMAGRELLAEELNQNICKALEFMAGAELYMLRKQYEMAAFHLHQAAEQVYSGIIRYGTGLRIQTHNLDKLYRYSKYLLPGIKEMFPRDTDFEKKLFYSLQKAYLGARYSTEYSIQRAGLNELFERIKKLLILCRSIQQKELTSP